MIRRFRAKCNLCDFISKPNAGAVFAAWDGLRHAKEEHPEADGLVAIIVEIPKNVYKPTGYCPYGFEGCEKDYCVPEKCEKLKEFLSQGSSAKKVERSW